MSALWTVLLLALWLIREVVKRWATWAIDGISDFCDRFRAPVLRVTLGGIPVSAPPCYDGFEQAVVRFREWYSSAPDTIEFTSKEWRRLRKQLCPTEDTLFVPSHFWGLRLVILENAWVNSRRHEVHCTLRVTERTERLSPADCTVIEELTRVGLMDAVTRYAIRNEGRAPSMLQLTHRDWAEVRNWTPETAGMFEPRASTRVLGMRVTLYDHEPACVYYVSVEPVTQSRLWTATEGMIRAPQFEAPTSLPSASQPITINNEPRQRADRVIDLD